MRELKDRDRLIAALRDARDYTLAVYAHLDEAALRFPYARTVNPPLWELAHVAWFQEHWCLRWCEGGIRTASFIDDADPMLNSALIAHRARWDLPRLTWPVVRDYMARVLDATIERIARSDPLDAYFPLLSLYHEDMHAEAYRMSLQTLGLPAPVRMRAAVPAPRSPVQGSESVFEGGLFRQGAVVGEDFVFDNELGAHEVRLEPFALATRTVTQGEYRNFVEAGGYGDARLWSPAGWEWCRSGNREHPAHWRREDDVWLARSFDRWAPLVDALPVTLISAHEAEAYASWVGARLPTESEWEYAARFDQQIGDDRYPWGGEGLPAGAVNLDLLHDGPVPGDALSGTDTSKGLRQMLGNVWEWTATPFAAYPGFVVGPYKEYSQPWFGDHRVLRGGSFATRSRLVHSRWRNFYTPDRTDVFCGIRLARTLSG